MITQEMQIMIRHFVKQGEPKACVARRLGISRPTIYRHLREKSEQPSQPRPSKLDAYKDYM